MIIPCGLWTAGTILFCFIAAITLSDHLGRSLMTAQTVLAGRGSKR
jgi:hypothetical protein